MALKTVCGTACTHSVSSLFVQKGGGWHAEGDVTLSLSEPRCLAAIVCVTKIHRNIVRNKSPLFIYTTVLHKYNLV